jgi:hypothetical protein
MERGDTPSPRSSIFDAAVRAHPSDPDARSNYGGRTAPRAGEPRRAIEQLDAAAALAPRRSGRFTGTSRKAYKTLPDFIAGPAGIPKKGAAPETPNLGAGASPATASSCFRPGSVRGRGPRVSYRRAGGGGGGGGGGSSRTARHAADAISNLQDGLSLRRDSPLLEHALFFLRGLQIDPKSTYGRLGLAASYAVRRHAVGRV